VKDHHNVPVHSTTGPLSEQHGSASHRSPESIVNDSELGKDEKIRVLSQWAFDEQLVAVAVNEGMLGPEPELLQRILNALGSVSHTTASQLAVMNLPE
jgi:hypothetical protein